MTLSKERIQTDLHQTINITMYSGSTHFKSPRIYRNDGIVKWSNPWHNCLSVAEDNEMPEVKMYYGYSPAHYKDPERCWRMAQKAIYKNPDSSRLRFYYSRELMYREQWVDAITSWHKYFSMSPWAVELEFSYYLCAQCYNHLGDWETAKEMCFKALALNSSHKGCINFLASLCGPGNAKRWYEFAKTADDTGILFKGE